MPVGVRKYRKTPHFSFKAMYNVLYHRVFADGTMMHNKPDCIIKKLNIFWIPHGPIQKNILPIKISRPITALLSPDSVLNPYVLFICD